MRFLFIPALFVTLLLAGSLAQQAPSQAAPKPGSVSGIVTQYGSGEPVRGAEVSISRQDTSGLANQDDPVTQGITVVTDRNGRFQFPTVSPGEFSLSVNKGGFHGFRSQNSRTWQEAMSLKLSPGQSITDLSLAMQPGGVITGRVTDESGEAMAQVRVAALKWTYASHRRLLRMVNVGTTDDAGNYRIFSLEPGRYVVRAMAPITEASKRLRYAPCYFPDATTAAEANTITLRPGEQSVADLRMSRLPVARISGHVTGTDPNQQTQIYLVNSQESGADAPVRGPSGAVDDHGNFTLESVFPGDYTLLAFGLMGDNAQGRYAELPLKVDGNDIKDLNLSLEEIGRASLQGSLHMDAANARHPRFDSLRIGLLPAEDSGTSTPFVGRGGYASIGRDGSVHLDNVAPGKYIVSITAEGSGWEDFYTKGVQVGGTDVTDSVVNINSPRGVIPISISVGIDGAYVEGTVTDEDNKPIANATVIGVPEQNLQNQFDLYQRGQSDQNGHFQLRGIKPGTYSFYAWGNMDDESYMDPEFLRRYDNARVDLTLNPKDRQTLHLTVQPTDLD